MVHEAPRHHAGAVEILQLHALDQGEWLASRPGRLTSEERCILTIQVG